MGNCLSIVYTYFMSDDDSLIGYKPLPDNDIKELNPVSSPRTLGSPYSDITDVTQDGDLSEEYEL